jgi:hypothetical protein
MTGTEEATKERRRTAINCSFCQKTAAAVASMIAGPGVFICDECVTLCVEILKSKPEKDGGPQDMPAMPSWQERASDEDLLATLPKVAALSSQVDEQLAFSVTQARTRGITWTRIGAALGTTRQSAWERFSGEE